jgi:hypothetical protein
MKLMSGLIRRNRPANEAMAILAAEEAKWQVLFDQAGRNDPCPCGSGRKFKVCHAKDGKDYPMRAVPIVLS